MKLIDILNHHLKGGKFEYKSFDFKAAKEEYEQTEEWINAAEQYSKTWPHHELQLKDKYQIPEPIRENHSLWRQGKLRKIEFRPCGKIFRVYIGARYSRSFYEGTEEVRLLK